MIYFVYFFDEFSNKDFYLLNLGLARMTSGFDCPNGRGQSIVNILVSVSMTVLMPAIFENPKKARLIKLRIEHFILIYAISLS